MSATVLQFRPLQFRSRPRTPAVYANELDRARDVLNQWALSAASYGWFLVAQPAVVAPRGRRKRASRQSAADAKITSFIIGHRAVDTEGIFELTLEFDGWAVLSRRGELSVFDTLPDALASICPTPIAA